MGTYNALVRQIRVAQNDVNDIIDNYNSRKYFTQSICRISGGIGLEPEKFKLNLKNGSPRLDQTKRIAQMADSSTVIQGEEWGRSTPTKTSAPRKTLQLNRSWVAGEKKQTQTATLSSARKDSSEQYWRSKNGAEGSWQDANVRTSTATERYYDADSHVLQAADFKDGKLEGCIVGKFDGRDSIVFEKSQRQNVASPQSPPNWWK